MANQISMFSSIISQYFYKSRQKQQGITDPIYQKMELEKEEQGKRQNCPLVYIKKSLDLSSLEEQPEAVAAMGDKKCVLFYSYYALIVDLKAPDCLSMSKLLLYPTKYPLKSFDVQTLQHGYCVYRDEIWEQYYKTRGSGTYSYLTIFPQCQFVGQCISQHQGTYVCPFIQGEKETAIFQSEQDFMKADDAGVVLSHIDYENKLLVFNDILKDLQCKLQMPQQLIQSKYLADVFMISISQILLVIPVYTILTLFMQQISYESQETPAKMRRLRGFPDCQRVQFRRRSKDMEIVVIHLASDYFTYGRYMVYNYRKNEVIRQINGCQGAYPFSLHLDLVVSLPKEEQDAKLEYYELASFNRLWIHLIHQGGLVSRFGKEIVRFVLQVVN